MYSSYRLNGEEWRSGGKEEVGSTPDVLAVPKDFTANFGLNSIRQDIPKIWNSLPDKIRLTTNKRTK